MPPNTAMHPLDPPAPVEQSRTGKLPAIAKFSGVEGTLESFLFSFETVFPDEGDFNDHTLFAYAVACLEGEAQKLVMLQYGRANPPPRLFSHLRRFLKQTYPFQSGYTVADNRAILHIMQGPQEPMKAFISRFSKLRAYSEIDDATARHVLLVGINQKMKDDHPELRTQTSYAGLFQALIRIGEDQAWGRGQSDLSMPAADDESKFAMDIDAVNTRQMRNRQQHQKGPPSARPSEQSSPFRTDQKCYACGGKGHYSKECANWKKSSYAEKRVAVAAAVDGTIDPEDETWLTSDESDGSQSQNDSGEESSSINKVNFARCYFSIASVKLSKDDPRLFIDVTLGGSKQKVRALVDCGAAVNLISTQTATNCSLRPSTSNEGITLIGPDGATFGKTRDVVKQCPTSFEGKTTRPTFYVTNDLSHDAILGYPWLASHNPTIDWKRHMICSIDIRELKDKIESLVKSIPEIDASKVEMSELPPHRPFDCKIDADLEHAHTARQPRRLTWKEESALNDYVDEQLRRKRIRPVETQFACPVLFVPKKNGEMRLCVDYRPLNALTRTFSYPTACVDEMIETASRARYYSTIDLREAFHQLRMDNKSEMATAFICSRGTFAFRVMPFGLKNAPAYFQAFVDHVFRDQIGKSVVVYMDDILVYSASTDSHVDAVKDVLAKLKKHGLQITPPKCSWGTTETEFLGFTLGRGQICAMEERVRAINEWADPTNVRELQRFLGFINYYRRFIKNFSAIATPLFALLKKESVWTWEGTQKSAFQGLKDALSATTKLRAPDRSLPFVVETDASKTAIGCALSQVVNGKLHPLAFHSRTMKAAEQNYPIFEQEALAVREALKKWSHYLRGGKYPVRVLTDHKNLLALKNLQTTSSRLTRWAQDFSQFDLELVYRKGSLHTKADALSRSRDHNEEPEHDPPTPVFKDVAAARLGRRISPYHTAALKKAHDSFVGGHSGIQSTINRLQDYGYQWDNMKKDAEDWVKSCSVCPRVKGSNRRPIGTLYPLTPPSAPFESISMDFIGGLPSHEGVNEILTVVDRFSKFTIFIPMTMPATANNVAKLLFQHVFAHYGFPKTIVSDRGRQFIAASTREWCRLTGIKQNISSAGHAQTDGQTERMHRTLIQFLRAFSEQAYENWLELLPLAQLWINTTVSHATGKAPARVLMGFQPGLGSGLLGRTVEHTFPAGRVLAEANRTFREVRQNLRHAAATMKKQADKSRRDYTFRVGQLVYVRSDAIRPPGELNKIDPTMMGPFRISEIISHVAVRLDLPPGMRIHNAFHVSKLLPASTKLREGTEPEYRLPPLRPARSQLSLSTPTQQANIVTQTTMETVETVPKKKSNKERRKRIKPRVATRPAAPNRETTQYVCEQPIKRDSRSATPEPRLAQTEEPIRPQPPATRTHSRSVTPTPPETQRPRQHRSRSKRSAAWHETEGKRRCTQSVAPAITTTSAKDIPTQETTYPPQRLTWPQRSTMPSEETIPPEWQANNPWQLMANLLPSWPESTTTSLPSSTYSASDRGLIRDTHITPLFEDTPSPYTFLFPQSSARQTGNESKIISRFANASNTARMMEEMERDSFRSSVRQKLALSGSSRTPRPSSRHPRPPPLQQCPPVSSTTLPAPSLKPPWTDGPQPNSPPLRKSPRPSTPSPTEAKDTTS